MTVPAESGDLRYRAVATRPARAASTIVVAVPLGEVDETLDRLLLVEALVILGVLLVLGVAAAWLVRLGLRPLDRMGTTAGIIARGDLSRRVTPATPRTEVGRLGLALNAMLERLEEAFAQRQASEDRLRRFLSDASHELRTPLASIRGYAELFRMGAAREPADVEKAMRRIEEEAARMGVLVEDLLALARLDEQREPVREPVDVSAIARDAVDDARATAPDRRIDVDAPSGAGVLADPHQLRQVLANLLRNAIVHTPAGTPVEVTVARAADNVVVQVRDHGPGLPDGDPDALFERFWRSEGGRERGRAGAGPRARHRRRDRRRAPRPRAGGERRGRRRVLHGDAPSHPSGGSQRTRTGSADAVAMTPTNQRLPNRRFRRLLPAAVATAALATTFTPLVAPPPPARAAEARPAPRDQGGRAADHAARGPRRREAGRHDLTPCRGAERARGRAAPPRRHRAPPTTRSCARCRRAAAPRPSTSSPRRRSSACGSSGCARTPRRAGRCTSAGSIARTAAGRSTSAATPSPTPTTSCSRSTGARRRRSRSTPRRSPTRAASPAAGGSTSRTGRCSAMSTRSSPRAATST